MLNHLLKESKPHCKERELQTPPCLSVTSVLLRFPQNYTDPHNYGAIKLIWYKRGHGCAVAAIMLWAPLSPAERLRFLRGASCQNCWEVTCSYTQGAFLSFHSLAFTLVTHKEGLKLLEVHWKPKSSFASIRALLQFLQFASCNWLLFQTTSECSHWLGPKYHSWSKVQSLTMRASRCLQKRIRMCSAT